jgi:DNA-binding transcriptional LysR family regulator/intracellular sulfur oxidation DsrE/DsrF family protein
MVINFQHLRAFAAVARYESFTLAAQKLHLTQPAISKAVRELEARLEITLLERTSRQVRLTEAGVALYEHAHSIFALEQAALEDVKSRRGLQRGRLTVGASTTIAGYWLPPYLTDFMQHFPAMEMRLVSANTEAICRQLLDCRLDLALVEGPVSDERIESLPWREEELIVIAPPGAALREKDLSGQCWVVREEGSGTGEVTRTFLGQLGISPARTVVVGSNTAMVQMVMSGAGVALAPERIAAHEISRGGLNAIKVKGGPLVRTLYQINLRHRPASPGRRAFETILAKTLALPVLALALILPFLSPTPARAQDDRGAPAATAPSSVTKVVFQVSDSNPDSWSMTLSNVRNLVKAVPDPRQRDIEIVAYGNGVEGLRFDSPYAERVRAIQDAGVKVMVCENTLNAKHYTTEDMLPDLGYVPLGALELVRKQAAGYAYIRP